MQFLHLKSAIQWLSVLGMLSIHCCFKPFHDPRESPLPFTHYIRLLPAALLINPSPGWPRSATWLYIFAYSGHLIQVELCIIWSFCDWVFFHLTHCFMNSLTYFHYPFPWTRRKKSRLKNVWHYYESTNDLPSLGCTKLLFINSEMSVAPLFPFGQTGTKFLLRVRWAVRESRLFWTEVWAWLFSVGLLCMLPLLTRPPVFWWHIFIYSEYHTVIMRVRWYFYFHFRPSVFFCLKESPSCTRVGATIVLEKLINLPKAMSYQKVKAESQCDYS